MTTENEQITPADAAIVSSGTGTKGPEERDLPASLKEEMDLCLQMKTCWPSSMKCANMR